MSESFRAGRVLRRGQVWTLDDAKLRLSSDLEGTGRKAKHRPCVVVSGDHVSAAPEHPYALIVPMTRRSTSSPLGRFEVAFPAGTAGLDYDSVAVVYLLQPWRKLDFDSFLGALPDAGTEELLATILDYLGLSGLESPDV